MLLAPRLDFFYCRDPCVKQTDLIVVGQHGYKTCGKISDLVEACRPKRVEFELYLQFCFAGVPLSVEPREVAKDALIAEPDVPDLLGH